MVLAATLLHPQPDLAIGWVSAAALGGALGFLVHNRHPARVFMGDAGSYFLGFLLPALLLQIAPVPERLAIIDVSLPLLVLALPLLDMGRRRLARRAARGAVDPGARRDEANATSTTACWPAASRTGVEVAVKAQ